MLYKSEMSDSPATSDSGVALTTPKRLGAQEKRQRWFEVGLVLLVAFGGSVLSAIFLLVHGPSAAAQHSNVGRLGVILHQTGALLLLGYVLSRRGLRFANLGLRWSLPDLWMGLLVTLVSTAAYRLGISSVQTIHYLVYGIWTTGPTAKDFFGHPTVLSVLVSFLNPFFEELLVRAYLMTEILELTGSSALAVVLSVGVQFSYHLYYGWGGAASLSFFFLALALYYVRSRSALPVVVAHGLLDIFYLFRA
jgi:membrane protease YdiL (CAAX protease family)